MLVVTRERITEQLLHTQGLVDAYQRNDPMFVARVIKWLSGLEDCLSQLRHPLTSLTASERGKVLAVEDGYSDTHIDGAKLSKRKKSQIKAVLALSRVEAALRETVKDIDEKFNAWSDKLSQLLAIASAKDPIPLPPTEPRQRWLNELWRSLGRYDEARAMHGYLNAVMSNTDRLHLLNELIENMTSGLDTQGSGPLRQSAGGEGKHRRKAEK